jgi:hypothetical protein
MGVHKAAVPMLVDLLMHVFVGVAVRVVVLLAVAHRILRVEPFVCTHPFHSDACFVYLNKIWHISAV